MDGPLRSRTSTIDIYIKLAQYPILADEIRLRMREEIYRRGVTAQAEFEVEVKRLATESQQREGLYDPFNQEPAAVWQERKARIRDYHTDFYFGHNLPSVLLDQLIQETLNDQPADISPSELTFNPELAPWELLFRQGAIYEALPPNELEAVRHHLEEIKVVLIKGMISDQLPYIGISKTVLTIADLRRVYKLRIGAGKIGGKAAGMLLAWKLLQVKNPTHGPDISEQVSIPDSFYLGTEVIYDFRLMNNLDYVMNQKYRPFEEIQAEYPKVYDAHMKGNFPADIIEQLRTVLEQVGRRPLIVRSSSLLEDNFGYSFAGKYDSFFAPNQGSIDENLEDLLNAIRKVYASSLNPDAILYRQQHGLIDYDERMAILIQCVSGEAYGRYFLPTAAGVAFSQNHLRWHPKIRRRDGFLRLVWGTGTRAVDRISSDYPRLVALSHPTLRPETSVKSIRQFSQRYADVIDLQDNDFKTLPAAEVLDEVLQNGYQNLKYVASLDHGDYMENITGALLSSATDNVVLTFDYLTSHQPFVRLMRTALSRIEAGYHMPVDVEFTVEITPDYPEPHYRLNILQCRPLSLREEGGRTEIPHNIKDEDLLFRSVHLIPDGRAEDVRYIIFVSPEAYQGAPDQVVRLEIGRAIGRLNKILEKENFILIGPGRWGSANIDLGVKVSYADIYNTKVLIEMAVSTGGEQPELSYGTHFYTDLVEAGIHSLPLHLDHPTSYFNWALMDGAANVIEQLSARDGRLAPYLKVIDLEREFPGRRLGVFMDGTSDEAVGCLTVVGDVAPYGEPESEEY